MSAGRFTARSPFLRGRSTGFEYDLINRLRKLPVGPTVDARFRADLRTQLVAITARIVAESSTAAEALPATAARARAGAATAVAATSRRSRGLFGHKGLSLAGLVAALALIAVSVTSLSRSALPGDTLYSVKRASENLALSLASGNEAKGREYLDQATTRAKEAKALLSRGPAAQNEVLSSLAAADTAGRNGTNALGHAAVSSLSAGPLDQITAWASTQQAALSDVAAAGSTAVATRAATSLALLTRIQDRAAALRANLGCPCLSSATSDDLGPLPCSPCVPAVGQAPVNPSRGSHLAPPGATLGPKQTPASGPTSASTGSGTGLNRASTVPGSTATGGVSVGLPLPSVVPLPSLSLPLLNLGGSNAQAPNATPSASSSNSGVVSGLNLLGTLGLN